MVLFTIVGCGGHVTARPTAAAEANQRPRSAAEVRRTFANHGIKLSREPLLQQQFLQQQVGYVALTGEVHGIEINVAVHPSIRGNTVVLVMGNGTPHVLGARNVSASWTGRDLPGVEDAMKQLR
jgi:hypothetical protein